MKKFINFALILLVFLTIQNSLAASNSYEKRYSQLEWHEGSDQSIKLYLHRDDFELKNNRDIKLRMRLETDKLYQSNDKFSNIKIKAFKYNDSNAKELINSQNILLSDKKKKLAFNFDLKSINNKSDDIFFSIFDTSNELINTYKLNLSISNLSEINSSSTSQIESSKCNNSEFNNCQLDYIFDNVSFVIDPKLDQTVTSINKTNTGSYQVNLPLPRSSRNIAQIISEALEDEEDEVTENKSNNGNNKKNNSSISSSDNRLEDLFIENTGLFIGDNTEKQSNISFDESSNSLSFSTTNGILSFDGTKLTITNENSSTVLGSSSPSLISENEAGDLILSETVDKKIAIGKSNADHELDVNGTVNATNFIGDGSALTGISLSQITENNTISTLSGAEVLTNKTLVSPTITSPALSTVTINTALKYIDGNQAASKVLTSDASGNASWQALPGGGGSGDIINGGNTEAAAVTIGTNDANVLNLETNNVTHLTLDATGRIGIGNNTPTTKLDVTGTVNATAFTGDGSGLSNIDMGDVNAGTLATARGGTGVSNGAGSMTFAGAVNMGANDLSFTTSGATTLTLPTTGTVATLAGTEILTNKTITSPVINTGLQYTDGNQGAGKVLTSDASGNATWQAAAGGGGGSFDPTGTNPGDTFETQYKELAANGSNYVGFKAPDSIASDISWVLPATDGTPGQYLQTDGSGNLSFAAGGGGGDFLADGTVAMTDPLVLEVLGSAGAPSLTFTSDTTMGIYRPLVGNMAFSTAGAERMRINSTEVNIKNELDVDGGANITGDATFNNQILMQTGAVGAPGYSFTGDPTTGIYRPVVGNVAVTTAGVQRLNINSTEVNVKNELDVDGGANFTGDATFNDQILMHSGLVGDPSYSFTGDTNTGMYRTAPGNIAWATTGTLRMTLNSTELNVKHELDVDGGANFTGDATFNDQILMHSGTVADPSYSFTGDTDTGMYRTTNDTIAFATGGVLRATINNTELNVKHELDVDGGANITGDATFNDQILINSGTVANPSYSFTGDTDTGIYRSTTNTMDFATNGVQRLTMSSSSAVFNEAGNDYDFRVEGDTSPNALVVDASADAVGIGTGTPARALHVNDVMRLQPRASAPGSPAAGDIYFDTSGAYCVYVDAAWSKIAGSGSCV